MRCFDLFKLLKLIVFSTSKSFLRQFLCCFIDAVQHYMEDDVVLTPSLSHRCLLFCRIMDVLVIFVTEL
jgi:hypothetical protein